MGDVVNLPSSVDGEQESLNSEDHRNAMRGLLVTGLLCVAVWTGIILAFVT